MSSPRTTQFDDSTLTRIGLGTNRLTDTPQNRAFLEAAVEAGVNLIDTAHLYAGGASESAIGSALAPFASDLVVATKGGYTPGSGHPDKLRLELEQSFERLRTDTITLYYLHRVDPSVSLEESLALLSEYRDAGRIEHIGVSQMSVEQIERAREVAPIAAVQNAYNLVDRGHDEVVDHCAREGILFVPFYPLRGTDTATVRGLARRMGATPHQVALAWLLRRSPTIVPIPGTLSIDHLRENLAAVGLDLSDDDYATLSNN
jgi:pyridoxine 4-dehydrogenase